MSALYGVGLLALLCLGMPVAASLLIVAAAGVLLAAVPLSIVAERLAFGLDNFTLIAIPMFLLMGNLMNASGITQRIFDFAVAMVGHWRGGLAQVWAPYELRDDGEQVHCGIDAVDLVYLDGAWRIASILSSLEAGACEALGAGTATGVRPRDGWKETPNQ